MSTKPKLLLCLAFAAVLSGCDTDDKQVENNSPAAENQPQKSEPNNVYVAKYASQFDEMGEAAAWSELTAEEWQKIAPSLQSALECKTPIPNTPEIRALLKGESAVGSNNFVAPVSEQYYKIMSVENTNVPQNTFGGDLNFVGALIPSDDFRVFGLPVKKLQITRSVGVGDFGGYYVWSTIHLPLTQINKAAGLKSDDSITTKAGELNSFAADGDDNILQCIYWSVVYSD
jgi:hypothetical protein